MTRGRSQRWVMDTFLGLGGQDILHPESQSAFEEFGYNHSDLARVFGRVKSGAMLPKAWSVTGAELERKGDHYGRRGLPLAERDLLLRAALCFGRAQYIYYRDDDRKSRFHAKLVQCYQRATARIATPVERVTIPFDGKTLYGVLHLPAHSVRLPAVILLPGMDMFKEDWHRIAQTYYKERGIACLAIDGPGQGESLLHGLKVDVTNYERACSQWIDYLAARREIDADRIGLFGVSMGSYWGTRAAGHDPRLKACATALGCYGTMEVIFNQAQPNFKSNFMYMAGYSDEQRFDEEIARHMHLREMAPRVRCPYLMGTGEFDELTPLEDALATFELVKAPKELWVYEWDFHPLSVAAELHASVADWLLQMLNGEYAPDMDNRFYIGRDGQIDSGAGKPPWWNPR